MENSTSLSGRYGIRASLLATLSQVEHAIAAADNPDSPCHFRRLPFELREQIYELTLFPQPQYQRLLAPSVTAPDTALNDPHGYEMSSGITITYRPPPLLQVSCQIRGEASKLFYSKVLFWKHSTYWNIWGDAKLLQRLLASLAPEDKELVRNIRLERMSFDDTNGLMTGRSMPFVGPDMRMFASLSQGGSLKDVEHLLEVPAEDRRAVGGWRYQKTSELARQEQELEQRRREFQAARMRAI